MKKERIRENSESLRSDISMELGRDFRLSFKFSQGKGEVQERLMCLLAIHYRQQFGVAHIPYLESVNWKDLAMPPRVHSAVTNKHVIREGKDQFENFKYFLQHPELDYFEEDPELYVDLLSDTLHHILIREARYAVYVAMPDRWSESLAAWTEPKKDRSPAERGKKSVCAINHRLGIGGRPNQPGRSRAISHVKKYIFDGCPTGSDRFNAIFRDLKSIACTYRPDALMRHAQQWEALHQQPFFTEQSFENLCMTTNDGLQKLAINALECHRRI